MVQLRLTISLTTARAGAVKPADTVQKTSAGIRLALLITDGNVFLGVMAGSLFTVTGLELQRCAVPRSVSPGVKARIAGGEPCSCVPVVCVTLL